MIYKVDHEGKTYTWLEKGARAALTVDGTNLLWMGDPCDPMRLRELSAPLPVLLELSILRNSGLEG